MGELVLEDGAGEFLLVHGNDDYLSLARRPLPSGEVPLVRFAPEHSPVLSAAIEAVLREPAAGAVSVQAGSDEMRVEAVGRQVSVANRARRRPDSPEPEALLLDRTVAEQMMAALRGPRLRPLGDAPRGAVLTDAHGRAAAVESAEGETAVSARNERAWARAAFPSTMRRVVAASLAMVVGNPGESAIRVAHVSRGRDHVLVERLASAGGGAPYSLANARPGLPARPRRTVRLTSAATAFVVRALATDEEVSELGPGTGEVGSVKG